MKKFFSYVTAFTVMAASCLPVYAAGPISTHTQTALIEEEIETRLEVVMDDIYVQLEAQDALVLLDIYEDLMRTHIERAVMAEHNIATTYDVVYNMTYGGVTHYFSPGVFGEKAPELTTTYLDPARTYKYLYPELDVIKAFIEDLGDLPFPDSISSEMELILAVPLVADAAIRANVARSDHYSMIAHCYSHEYDTEACVITGWVDHTLVNRPSDAINFEYVKFSQLLE